MRVYDSKRAQGTWEEFKVIVLFLVLIFVVIVIYMAVFGGGKKALSACQGICSNQIVKEKDGSYTSLGTCEEVNQKLGKEKYKGESYGDCTGGAQCCMNLIYDQPQTTGVLD
ncbi:MAG: hypothetical protein NT001_00130 [Candidatus Woesearchaeota archaeon]|nr:hypothetical protein [Candidatus Woesearchaeota archaeon]